MITKKMNNELMKKYNKTSLLQTLWNAGPISRSEIADLTNLCRPTVSEIVAELIEERWIEELDSIKGGRGRRPVPLQVNPFGRFVIGVEIRRQEITIIVSNLLAKIQSKYTYLLNGKNDADSVLNKIVEGIQYIQNTIPREQLLGVGIAVPGVVEPRSGVSLFAPSLGWRNVAIAEKIQHETGLLTIIDNDVICIATAEYWYGNGKGKSNFVTLRVDKGIGGSVFIDGKVYRGVHNSSARIGHTTVADDGPKCSCGNYGCLETTASESAIIELVEKRLRMGQPSTLNKYLEQGLNIEQVYSEANRGDQLSLEVLKHAAYHLGVGISHLINLFDPELLIISGGITKVESIILPPIQDIIQKRIFNDEAKRTPVVVSRLQEHPYSVGAATLVIEKIFTIPQNSEPSGIGDYKIGLV